MRKKNHKKINPRDSNYDKYYLVNYLEFGKSWEKSSKDKSDKPFEVRDIQKLRAQFFLTIGQNNFGNKIPIWSFFFGWWSFKWLLKPLIKISLIFTGWRFTHWIWFRSLWWRKWKWLERLARKFVWCCVSFLPRQLHRFFWYTQSHEHCPFFWLWKTEIKSQLELLPADQGVAMCEKKRWFHFLKQKLFQILALQIS